MKIQQSIKKINIYEIGIVFYRFSIKIKRVKVFINRIGDIHLVIPQNETLNNAIKFAVFQKEWIQKTKINQKREILTIIDFNIDIIKLEIFKENMIARINDISKANLLPFNKVIFKHMFSRWGSCSRINNISLNNLLYHLSDDLKDYVIKHELVHTKVKNHGKEFWNMLESVCENSKKKRYSLNNSYFIKTY